MTTAGTHQILSISEILEMILLHCDSCTLLTSAQRVCHYWHDLILNSGALQEALFFKPAQRQSAVRVRNPLLENKLWPQLFRKRFQFPDNFYVDEIAYTFPDIDPISEEAYLRKGASWRRMLMQQPPTKHIGIIEIYPGWREHCPSFTKFEFRHHGRSFLMSHLLHGITTAALMPQEKPWLFCDQDWFARSKLDIIGIERDKDEVSNCVQQLGTAISMYLPGCDVLVITDDCKQVVGSAIGPVDWWLRALSTLQISETQRRERIQV
ncbi:hypothetical protein BDV26DRAFT_255142 [Aspergillus bertholletiae]|uniref:F-box domain-containing protein n=1 Tax=Aspergillus bertholletiae TaxID=1226010 RepID=A0A5N7BIK2_9EURO|nr:hypothetical protein BDV26DRAFT_255142 [Aspergillus bertholletiae]